MKIVYRVLSFVVFFVLLMGLFLTSTDHVAAEKKGKGPHKTLGPPQRPYGWDKGKKEGWGGKDVPPGLEDKGTWNKDKSSGTKKKTEREAEKEQKKEGKKAEKAKKKKEGAEKETKKGPGNE